MGKRHWPNASICRFKSYLPSICRKDRMDTSNTIPYEPEHLGEGKTSFVTVDLGNRRIEVGYQPEHPSGPGYIHRIFRKKDDGTVTELKFFMLKDAVEALILCYKSHGLIELNYTDVLGNITQEQADEALLRVLKQFAQE